MEATKVGIREFRAGMAEFIASSTPVAVTRHGQTIGYFIPTHGQVEADIAFPDTAADEERGSKKRRVVSPVDSFEKTAETDVNRGENSGSGGSDEIYHSIGAFWHFTFFSSGPL